MRRDRPAFGTWLALQLQRREMSQADFCRATGFPSSTVSQLINGQRQPTAKSAERIADGLHIDTSDVLRAAGLLDEPGEDLPEVRAILRRLREIDPQPHRFQTLMAILDDWLKVDASRHGRKPGQ